MNKLTVLSTRPLSTELLALAAANQITIECHSFIETEPIQSIEVQQELEQVLLQSATIVFTSMNAIEAVALYLEDQRPDWQIYAIGQNTQHLVSRYFGEDKLVGTAENAGALAEKIIADGNNDMVYFFCGDQRRPELPDKLSQAGIEVVELVVYSTATTPAKMENDYAAILFFSPSAVHSYFSMNKPSAATLLFAIGSTTAKTIQHYSNNRVLITGTAGKEALVQEMISILGAGSKPSLS